MYKYLIECMNLRNKIIYLYLKILKKNRGLQPFDIVGASNKYTS